VDAGAGALALAGAWRAFALATPPSWPLREDDRPTPVEKSSTDGLAIPYLLAVTPPFFPHLWPRRNFRRRPL